MHSYFWLVPPPKKDWIPDHVAYTKQALKQDVQRVRTAWDECQGSRKRDAIYGYLTPLFDLISWWTAENRAVSRAHRAVRLHNVLPFDHEDPFAAIIRCTADPAKVDKRTRSKWSRVLRYAHEYKLSDERLDQFVRRGGGINECASRFSRNTGKCQRAGGD